MDVRIIEVHYQPDEGHPCLRSNHSSSSPCGTSSQRCYHRRSPAHPLVGHRPRIDDRVIFDKLIEVLVFGAAYWRIVGGHEKCTEMGTKSAQVSGVSQP